MSRRKILISLFLKVGVPKKIVKPIVNGKYDPKLAFRSGLDHFWTTWRRRRPKKIFRVFGRFLPRVSRFLKWHFLGMRLSLTKKKSRGVGKPLVPGSDGI